MRGNAADDVEMSNQGLNQFPQIDETDSVETIDVSSNSIRDLPYLDNFVTLRSLNISNNKISDLKPLSGLQSIIELNCSSNSIESLEPLSSLSTLKVLIASNNRIREITKPPSKSLIEIDLANNKFESFEFLQDKLGNKLQNLDISGNNINEIRSLRYIAVFTQLISINVGLVNQNPELKVAQFAKYLCPMLENIDGADCADIDTTEDFNADALIDILVNGTEGELRAMLAHTTGPLQWDEPQFVPFEADIPATPLKGIEERLRKIEQKIPEETASKPEKTKDTVSQAELREIREEISELREQVIKLSELLYVHDCAMKAMWESNK